MSQSTASLGIIKYIRTFVDVFNCKGIWKDQNYIEVKSYYKQSLNKLPIQLHAHYIIIITKGNLYCKSYQIIFIFNMLAET